MRVDIVTPVGEQFVGEAVEVVAPGSIGEFGVLPRHRDMCVSLGVGVCRIRKQAHGELSYLLVDEGYLHVMRGDRIIIVTEHAETASDVDVAKAKTALDRARAELDNARERVGKASWQVKKHAVDLEAARIRLVELAAQ